MRLDLGEGAVRDLQVPQKIAGAFAPLPFRDVGRDGDHGPPDLVGQAEPLLPRPRPARGVHRVHQIHRPLPHQQIPITPPCHIPPLSLCFAAVSFSVRMHPVPYQLDCRPPSHWLLATGYWLLATGYSVTPTTPALRAR